MFMGHLQAAQGVREVDLHVGLHRHADLPPRGRVRDPEHATVVDAHDCQHEVVPITDARAYCLEPKYLEFTSLSLSLNTSSSLHISKYTTTISTVYY